MRACAESSFEHGTLEMPLSRLSGDVLKAAGHDIRSGLHGRGPGKRRTLQITNILSHITHSVGPSPQSRWPIRGLPVSPRWPVAVCATKLSHWTCPGRVTSACTWWVLKVQQLEVEAVYVPPQIRLSSFKPCY